MVKAIASARDFAQLLTDMRQGNPGDYMIGNTRFSLDDNGISGAEFLEYTRTLGNLYNELTSDLSAGMKETLAELNGVDIEILNREEIIGLQNKVVQNGMIQSAIGIVEQSTGVTIGGNTTRQVITSFNIPSTGGHGGRVLAEAERGAQNASVTVGDGQATTIRNIVPGAQNAPIHSVTAVVTGDVSAEKEPELAQSEEVSPIQGTQKRPKTRKTIGEPSEQADPANRDMKADVSLEEAAKNAGRDVETHFWVTVGRPNDSDLMVFGRQYRDAGVEAGWSPEKMDDYIKGLNDINKKNLNGIIPDSDVRDTITDLFNAIDSGQSQSITADGPQQDQLSQALGGQTFAMAGVALAEANVAVADALGGAPKAPSFAAQLEERGAMIG